MSGLRFPNWARRDAVDRHLSDLARPVSAPDVSAAVLRRVHAQQPFLSRRGRAWRLGALAGIGLALVGVAVGALAFGRWSARIVPGLAEPTPLVDLVRSAERDAALHIRAIALSGRSLLESVVSPARPPSQPSSLELAAYSAAFSQALRAMVPLPDLGESTPPLRPWTLASPLAPAPSAPVDFAALPSVRLPLMVPAAAVSAARAPQDDEPAPDFADQIAGTLAGQAPAPPALPR
ncbi:MAG: hypothetical protein JNJ48_07675 [Phycisphaerae bacterium]|nr:hypothetical protein [Phycisphaerae bacterium]